MEKKRKISIRKVLQALVTVIVTAACITAVLSAKNIHNERKVRAFDIHIKNQKCRFVEKEEVKNVLLNVNHLDMKKTGLSQVDINRLERVINANPWVAKAQVYIDNDMVLHANVVQRVPVVRLFDQAGNSYYLDDSLKEMPLSRRYVHYTTVVTNVPVLHNDSASKSLKGQIVALVKFIEQDTFWNAQVSQVIVTDDKTFEVVPVLGKHRIIIGDTSNMQQKFDNLFAFYKKILNRVGWDKYEVLDLRYAGQVVASPALPWKMPVDKAMSNMSWVKAVIDAGAKDAADKQSAGSTMTVAPATVAKKEDSRASALARNNNVNKVQPAKQTEKKTQAKQGSIPAKANAKAPAQAKYVYPAKAKNK